MKRLLLLLLVVFMVGCSSPFPKTAVKETSPIAQSDESGQAMTRTRYPLAEARGFTLTEPEDELSIATGMLRLSGHFSDTRWMRTLTVILIGPDGRESGAQHFAIDADGYFSGNVNLGMVPGTYEVQIHAPQLFEMSPLNVAMGQVMTLSVENRAAIHGPPGITAEQALYLAAKLHDPKDHLVVRFDPEFEYESKGDKTVRPTWIVQTLSPSPYVAVFVDAETGDHFRVMQSEAPSPTPEDLGFIRLDTALESGSRGVNTGAVEFGRGDLLREFRFDHPTKGQMESAVWRFELLSKGDRRPRGIMIVDATTGEVVSVSNPPSGQ